jgi:hypothetical protein
VQDVLMVLMLKSFVIWGLEYSLSSVYSISCICHR